MSVVLDAEASGCHASTKMQCCLPFIHLHREQRTNARASSSSVCWVTRRENHTELGYRRTDLPWAFHLHAYSASVFKISIHYSDRQTDCSVSKWVYKLRCKKALETQWSDRSRVSETYRYWIEWYGEHYTRLLALLDSSHQLSMYE